MWGSCSRSSIWEVSQSLSEHLCLCARTGKMLPVHSLVVPTPFEESMNSYSQLPVSSEDT